MEEKYQCHICMELAQKPIVTPCGHLFWFVSFNIAGNASITGSDPINNT